MYNPAVAVVYETETPAAPRSGLGPYRAEDYFQLPEEPRCELLYGRLLVTPTPNVRHQEVLITLAVHFGAHARRCGDRTVPGPVDVVLAPHSVVQPDIVYILASRSAIIEDHITGAPDLVVEVLSPAIARRDLGERLELYAEAGVAEYWIVDPATRTFRFLAHRDGAFSVRSTAGDVYRSTAVAGLEIDVEAFWRELPESPE